MLRWLLSLNSSDILLLSVTTRTRKMILLRVPLVKNEVVTTTPAVGFFVELLRVVP